MASLHRSITIQCQGEPVLGTTVTASVSIFSRLLLAFLLFTSSIDRNGAWAQETEDFDWRLDNVISPVSDSSELVDSAFIVVAEGVESLLAIETEQPLVLVSRNQVADCCEELYPLTNGYSCVVGPEGLCPSSTPQMSTADVCRSTSCPAFVTVKGTNYIPPNREDEMVNAIHKTPLTAAIYASHESFQNYNGGIYFQANCSTTELDHLVQIVGYGTTPDAQDYWIIKNSWGTSWGERGYMRIVRGQNMCGIASNVFYPELNI
ncbi:hypothetical protein BsWGS_18419 [Bradybaena similaris]